MRILRILKILENYEFLRILNGSLYGFLKFVTIRDFPVFHCFEYKLYFYPHTAIIYNKSLQTVYVYVLAWNTSFRCYYYFYSYNTTKISDSTFNFESYRYLSSI